MTTKLIVIGNSKGIRLPKALLEQGGLTGEIDLEVQTERLLVRPRHSARRGWDAAFARMRARGDDRLLDASSAGAASDWDRTEWTW